MSSRAIRRHNRLRMVAKAKRKLQEYRWSGWTFIAPRMLHITASKIADNLKWCPSWMCSKRNSDGDTRQEIRIEEYFSAAKQTWEE